MAQDSSTRSDRARTGRPAALRSSSLRLQARQALWRREALWRLANGRAVLRHRRARPVLRAEAQRCLSDLRRDGVAVTTLGRLTGDDQLLDRLVEHAQLLEQLQADRLSDQQGRLAQGELVEGSDKVFVVQLLGRTRPVVEPAGLLAQVALHDQVQGLADSYFGMATRVSDLNVWRSLPSGTAPVSSQLWHRDVPEDRVLVKVFVYLEPVTLGSGPFRYAVGTQPGGPAPVEAPTEFDGQNHRVPEGAAAAELEGRERVFTGPAGTVVVADTFGYHRGGWATTASRLVLQARYTSGTATGSTRLGTPDTLSRADLARWRERLAYDPRVTGRPWPETPAGAPTVRGTSTPA